MPSTISEALHLVKLSRISWDSTLRKSSSWLISSSSRCTLLFITTRLRRVRSLPSPDFNMVSSGALISERGVRISWAMLVKNPIFASYSSFSLAWLNFTILRRCEASIRRFRRYIAIPKSNTYTTIIALDSMKGRFTASFSSMGSLQTPSLLAPLICRMYLPAGMFIYSICRSVPGSVFHVSSNPFRR